MKVSEKALLNDYATNMRWAQKVSEAILLCTKQHKAEVSRLLSAYSDVLFFNIKNELDECNYGCILNNIFEFTNNEYAVDALLDSYKAKRLEACSQLQALAVYGITTDEEAVARIKCIDADFYGKEC